MNFQWNIPLIDFQFCTFTLIYHSNYKEKTLNPLKQFFIMWVKMSVMNSLKFNIISTYFPMVSEWLCLCFHLFFRMEPCYLLMVNRDPVLFSLTQRMKFFHAVLVVIKIELTKLFYAIISVVYYQWQKPNYYTSITHLTYTMLVLRWFSRLLSPF